MHRLAGPPPPLPPLPPQVSAPLFALPAGALPAMRRVFESKRTKPAFLPHDQREVWRVLTQVRAGRGWAGERGETTAGRGWGTTWEGWCCSEVASGALQCIGQQCAASSAWARLHVPSHGAGIELVGSPPPPRLTPVAPVSRCWACMQDAGGILACLLIPTLVTPPRLAPGTPLAGPGPAHLERGGAAGWGAARGHPDHLQGPRNRRWQLSGSC